MRHDSMSVNFVRFYLYLCHVLLRLTLVLNCNTKISEKSDKHNPEQLFVAQELINKVKSKCCGMKE